MKNSSNLLQWISTVLQQLANWYCNKRRSSPTLGVLKKAEVTQPKPSRLAPYTSTRTKKKARPELPKKPASETSMVASTLTSNTVAMYGSHQDSLHTDKASHIHNGKIAYLKVHTAQDLISSRNPIWSLRCFHSRGGVLRMQNFMTHLLRIQNSEVLPLKPGVRPTIAMHASPTARDMFLQLFLSFL